MKLILILTATLLVSVPALAATELANQINSVYAVQQGREAASAAAVAARQAEQRQIDAENQAERQRIADKQDFDQAKLAQQQNEERTAARAEAVRRAASATAHVKHEQEFQDQVRQLQLDHERLRVQAERSHVNRENEFIDAQLKRQTAETDVVQSSADANRNVSSGVKTYLEKTGEAEVKSASKR